MLKYFKIFVSLFVFKLVYSQESNIKIRLFTTQNIYSFAFIPVNGTYNVISGGKEILRTRLYDILYIQLKNNKISLSYRQKNIGEYDSLKIKGISSTNIFKIKATYPSTKAKIYDDDLILKVLNNNLLIINNITLDKYIAGVVESEVGKNAQEEFYKAQAIICRTYALKNFNRHTFESFNLCDDVHCQAYKHKCTSIDIYKAVYLTSGLVIVDDEINLITAAFHSNCGGETANSEDVWNLALPYLRSVKDTFCINKKHYSWVKKIPKNDWADYLTLKFGLNSKESSMDDIFYFTQNERKYFLNIEDLKIPLKIIRNDWKLKSTYFNIIPKGDYIYIKGYGYGHGVGLCQEGAMEMAKDGFTYSDILNFYYKNIHIINLSFMDFFKENEKE